VLAGLELAVVDACSRDGEWPAQVAAAIYAGVDFAIAHPVIAQLVTVEEDPAGVGATHYERMISRLAGLIRAKAPVEARLPGSTDEALVSGIVGLVGDHIRIDRPERLAELRPELVLLALLPYLGFAEAQRWSNQAARG